ncbi:MAG: molybdopterin molybdotransferase MoeA [Algisphaera sp.]
MNALPTYDDALKTVLAGAQGLGVERVALGQATGRVLREAVAADRDQPPFERAAMDGFAVVSGAWKAGGVWEIAGTVPAGGAWEGAVDPASQVLGIATGAAVPAPFDAVVQVELAQVNHAAGTVQFDLDKVAAWRNVHRRGADAAAGDKVLPVGLRLGPQHLALAATFGQTTLAVTQRPKVVVLSSGDEVVDPATSTQALGPQQIRNSNGPLLSSLLTTLGAELLEHRHVADTPDAVREACQDAAARADWVVTAGGVSVGERDLFPGTWKAMGFDTVLHGVAMQPGKPVLAVRGNQDGRTVHVLGLPGNPVSVLATAHLFAWPLLRALEADPAPLPWRSVRLAQAAKANPKRTAFRPAKLMGDGLDQAMVLSWRGSGDLAHTAAAEGLLALPPMAGEWAAGQSLRFLPFAKGF